MDKINTGYFNASIPDFDSLKVGLQQKLFVNIPDRTKVKGNSKFQLVDQYFITLKNRIYDHIIYVEINYNPKQFI